MWAVIGIALIQDLEGLERWDENHVTDGNFWNGSVSDWLGGLSGDR